MAELQAETQSGVAERLYYDSPGLEFTAHVTDIRLVATDKDAPREQAQLWQVALDRTAFYPESGGQPWDTGVLVATARSGATLEVPVERVVEDETTGEVWHLVRKPLVEGAEVAGRVDAERRRDHMQQHSGQHLLSAVFLEQFGAPTVSFHLGAESSTIDLAMREGMQTFTPEQIEAVEDEVNRLIFEDRPLTPHWHTREEAEAMLADGRLRKLADRTGPIRVVAMHGVEFNACGGTHVCSTGAIGGLLIRRLEKVKQGWRVEFVCGLRAVRMAQRDFTLLSGVAGSLSVGAADLPARISALQEENKSAAKRQRALMDELADARAAALLAGSAEGDVLEAIFPDKPVDFAKRIGSVAAREGRSAVLGVVENGSGAIALAVPPGSGKHAGEELRAVLPVFGGRGGGSNEMAQGICPADQVGAAGRALGERLR